MQKKQFGNTNIQVTPLCLGTAVLGNMPDVFGFSVNKTTAKETIKKFFQSPINFLDTSANYGDAENIIGEVIDELGGTSKGYIIQTKADRNSLTGDFSGEQIKKSIEKSLKTLGVNKLQIVYIHDPEHTTFENIMSPNGPLDVLLKFKQEGIIEHIGISGGPIDMLIRYIETDMFEAVITHNRFNLLYRLAEPLIDLSFKKKIAVINAAPFGGGLLADKKIYAYQEASNSLQQKADKMREICEKYKVSLKAVALHFVLKDLRITSTIIGPASPDELDNTLSLTNEIIPEGIWPELEKHAIFFGEDPETGRFK